MARHTQITTQAGLETLVVHAIAGPATAGALFTGWLFAGAPGSAKAGDTIVALVALAAELGPIVGIASGLVALLFGHRFLTALPATIAAAVGIMLVAILAQPTPVSLPVAGALLTFAMLVPTLATMVLTRRRATLTPVRVSAV